MSSYNRIKCYRPLQQIYKTVYSPSCGLTNSLGISSVCITQPLERYKTTNMTYGSFHYNNWAFIQKNRPKKKVNFKKDSSSPINLDQIPPTRNNAVKNQTNRSYYKRLCQK